jgi:integrase/recombinase XerD
MSPVKLPKTLTKDEVLSLLSQPNKRAPTGLRNRCILQLMYRAGLRASELINLSPKDLEWEEGVLRVLEWKGCKR